VLGVNIKSDIAAALLPDIGTDFMLKKIDAICEKISAGSCFRVLPCLPAGRVPG